MPIRTPQGNLDIQNAILRGSIITTTSNVGVANANPVNTLSVGSNLHVSDTGLDVLRVSGNVVAETLKIGAITLLPSYTFGDVSNVGNVTANVVQFRALNTAFITTSNVGIANTVPVHTLDIGANLYANDTSTAGDSVLTARGTISALRVKSNIVSDNVSTTTLVSTSNVGVGVSTPNNLFEIRDTTQRLDAADAADLSHYQHIISNTSDSGTNKEIGVAFVRYPSGTIATSVTPGAAITHERTAGSSKGKLHFKTKQSASDGAACTTAMTIHDDGKVGVGTLTPTRNLDIVGTVGAVTTQSNIVSNTTQSNFLYGKLHNSSNVVYTSGLHGPIVGSNAIAASTITGTTTRGTNITALTGFHGPIVGSNAISASTITGTTARGTNITALTGFHGPIVGSNAIAASTITGTSVTGTTTRGTNISALTGFHGPIVGSNAIAASTITGTTTRGTNVTALTGFHGPIVGSNTIAASTITGTTTRGTNISALTGFHGPIVGSNAIAASTITGTSVTIADYLIHAGDTNTKFGFAGADTITMTTAGSERVRVDSSGNFGVGTTNPTAALHVYKSGSAAFTTVESSGAHMAQLQLKNSNGYFLLRCDGTSGDLLFLTGNQSGPVFKQNGNVGIGTTSPTGNLQITSDLANASNQINPAAQLVLHSSLAGLDDDGDIGASLVFTQRWSDSDPNSQGTMGSIHGYKNGAAGSYGGGLIFKTQPGSDTTPVERMRIDKTGNVGIGTNNPSAGKLDIFVPDGGTGIHIRGGNYGTDNGEAHIRIGGGGASNDNISHHAKITGGHTQSGSSYLSFSTLLDYGTHGNNPIERMRINHYGYVGIGSNSPKAFTHIGKLSANSGTHNTIPGSNIGVSANFPTSTHLWLGNHSAAEANDYWGMAMGTLYSGNSYIQTLDKSNTSYYDVCLQPNGGNVGIGTNDPSVKLHIDGSTAFDGGTTVRMRCAASQYGRCQLHIIGRYEGNNDAWSATGARTGLRFLYQTTSTSAYTEAWTIQAFPNGASNDLGFLSGTNSTPRVMFKGSDGYVGVGTTTPHCPMAVYGTGGAMSSASKMYFRHDVVITTSTQTGGHSPMSIYGNGAIVSGDYFVSHNGTLGASDERIKKNIVDADDAECLETLRLLKPKKYEYKDIVERGEEPVWGFIAQEVRDTLPHATQLRQDVLPNIYELANVSSSNVITFTNFNTANLLTSNATTLIRSFGPDNEQHDIHLEEVIDEHTIRVKEDLTNFSGSLDAEGNVISEITTTTITPEEYKALRDTSGYVANITGYQNRDGSISVEAYNALEDTAGYEEIIQDYTKTNTIYPGNQLFVHGQEVDDFIFLKKEAIWTVATAALQEVDRQLQAEKTKTATLETQVAALLTRVAALENA